MLLLPFFSPNLTPCLLDSTHCPRSVIFSQAQSPSLCYKRILKQHTLTWASVCNSVAHIFPLLRPNRWCNPRTNAPGLCQSHSVLFLHGTRNVRPHQHQSQPSTTSVSKCQETQHGYKAACKFHNLIMHHLFLFVSIFYFFFGFKIALCVPSSSFFGGAANNYLLVTLPTLLYDLRDLYISSLFGLFSNWRLSVCIVCLPREVLWILLK